MGKVGKFQDIIYHSEPYSQQAQFGPSNLSYLLESGKSPFIKPPTFWSVSKKTPG